MLLLCASFYLTFSALCDAVRLSLSSILLLAACAAFNPVVLYQSLSFYVDAQLASVLLCLAALLYLFYLRPVRPIGILLILIGCYLINLKFTGLIYLIIVGGGVIIIALMDNKISLARQYLKIGFATVLMGLLVFGCHPYITNFRDHGHPIFPLMGNGKVDIMTTTSIHLEGCHVGPREFDNSNVNRVNKLLQSLGSKSTVGKAVRAKIPFQVKKGELTAFYNADVRLGGFGPLFSGILLLFIGLLIYWAVSRQGNRNFYAITLLVFTSVLANPGAWWARYVPQLWLMPVIAAMFAIGFQKRTSIKIAGYLMAVVILLNIGLVGAPYLHHQLTSTKLVLAQLKNLEERPLPLKVEFFYFRSNRVRFAEHGIGYLELTGIAHENSTRLYGSMTRIQSE